MIETDWYGLYKEGWRQEIVKDSFAHPAKFARGLIRRIYEHAFEQGYLKEGDWVIDPFAGVALGALDAMLHGLHWIGLELEEKFVGWGRGCDCDGTVKIVAAASPFPFLPGDEVLPSAGPITPARCGKNMKHEPHHVLGNIELWNRKYGGGRMPRWGTALLLCGDSRYLKSVLSKATVRIAALLTSPPYLTGGHHRHQVDAWNTNERGQGFTPESQGYGDHAANLGNMPTGELGAVIGSPPYAGSEAQQSHGRSWREELGEAIGSWRDAGAGYGEADGNLGNMREGDIKMVLSSPPWGNEQDGGKRLLNQRDEITVGRRACGYRNQGEGEGQLGQMETGDIDAVISSPPYIDSMDTDSISGIDWEKAGRPDRCSPSEERRSPTVDGKMAYGETEGQVGGMEEGDLDAIVSSPPYADAQAHPSIGSVERDNWGRDGRDIVARHGLTAQYGIADGQLGELNIDTFWSASSAVVSQCHQVLAPGGIAIWVVKDFVRNKKRIPFCDQWRRPCESVGFETMEIARVWFIDDYGVQENMFGPPVDVKKRHKSFFRLVYENKARAEKHWNESVCRDDRAHYLTQSHRDAWEEYKVCLLEEDEEEPPYPSRHRILHLAQKSAYKDADSPDLPIDVAIDYEVILFMRKVEDETKTV